METRIELPVTENKLLELIALFSDYEQNVAGLSSKELRQASGLSPKMLDKVLNDLIAKGLVVCRVGRRRYRDGRNGVVPVYTVTEQGNEYASPTDAS